MSVRTRKATGIAIIAISIVLFFWWGSHFRVFGSAIKPTLPVVGFFCWIVLGSFGVGFSLEGWRAGLKFAFGLLVAMALALGIGVLRGAYG
jgi:hypothetical protein